MTESLFDRSEEMVDVGAVEDFTDGRGTRVMVDGGAVALFRRGDRFNALDDCCSHAMAPLHSGEVKNGAVACPRHGARFDIATGEVLSLQAVGNVTSFRVEVRGGRVLVSRQGRMVKPIWATGRQLGEVTEARG